MPDRKKTHQGGLAYPVWLLNHSLTDAEAIPVTIIDPETGQEFEFDAITGALKVIDIVHHEVHEGEHHTASYMPPNDAKIADNDAIEMLLVTGAKYDHLLFVVACGGDCEVQFYEDTTTSDDGTALAVRNNKRTEPDTAATAAYHTPTITDDGNQLLVELAPGGSGGNSQGGATEQRIEWISKPSSKYLVRGINRSGGAQLMSIVAGWYEESDN